MNALIIDDELPAQRVLQSILKEHCPQVKVMGSVFSAGEARDLLRQQHIDLLFLDVNMPRESGFDLLNSISSLEYCVIFVTGNQEYAIRALRASAVDFLLKPVDIDELKDAVKRVESLHRLRREHSAINSTYGATISELSDNLTKGRKISKLTLNHLQGFKIISMEDILYLEADRNYTVFHMVNGERDMVSRNMGEYEDLLDPAIFFRVHKSFIINLHHLKEYSTVDGYFAIMRDGSSVIVSRRRVDDFMNAINRFTEQR